MMTFETNSNMNKTRRMIDSCQYAQLTTPIKLDPSMTCDNFFQRFKKNDVYKTCQSCNKCCQTLPSNQALFATSFLRDKRVLYVYHTGSCSGVLRQIKIIKELKEGIPVSPSTAHSGPAWERAAVEAHR
jgi:hypothetical protein